jgi:hypothetical protein
LFFNNLEEVKVLLGEQGIALCGVLRDERDWVDCIGQVVSGAVAGDG